MQNQIKEQVDIDWSMYIEHWKESGLIQSAYSWQVGPILWFMSPSDIFNKCQNLSHAEKGLLTKMNRFHVS